MLVLPSDKCWGEKALVRGYGVCVQCVCDTSQVDMFRTVWGCVVHSQYLDIAGQFQGCASIVWDHMQVIIILILYLSSISKTKERKVNGTLESHSLLLSCWFGIYFLCTAPLKLSSCSSFPDCICHQGSRRPIIKEYHLVNWLRAKSSLTIRCGKVWILCQHNPEIALQSWMRLAAQSQDWYTISGYWKCTQHMHSWDGAIGIDVTLLLYNHDFNVSSGSHAIVSLFSCSFLEECGSELKTLKLACCRYITRNTLATIGRVCKDLEGALLILVCTTIVCENVHHICSHNNLQ